MNKKNIKKINFKKNNKKSYLYLISPEKFELINFYKQLKEVLSTKTISIFQLRTKKIKKNKLIIYIKKLYPLCKKNNVLFILNDNPVLVKALDLDGVHVGEKDASIKKCREIIGKNKIIGRSCYNSTIQAIKAQNNGADYVAFGSFFKTETKKNYKKINKNQIRRWINFKRVPVVGIGGINIKNFKKISKLNLDFYALSSAVWRSRVGPSEYLKKFKNIIDNY